MHLLRCFLCFSFYLLPPPFYLSSPLFFSPFFLLPQLSHLLLLFCLSLLSPFFSFLPITLLFLSFSFVPFFFLFSLSHSSFYLSPLSLFFFFSPYHTPLSVFLLCPFFFLRELLVLSAFQDVIKDTTSCNRMQFIRNKERLVMSMNFPIACLFYITELFEVSN